MRSFNFTPHYVDQVLRESERRHKEDCERGGGAVECPACKGLKLVEGSLCFECSGHGTIPALRTRKT